MLTAYQVQSKSDNFKETTDLAHACWISMVDPTIKEMSTIAKTFGVERSFLRAALDRDEGARSETEGDQTLIIFDVPTIQKNHDQTDIFQTLPLAVILLPKTLITVTLDKNAALKSLLRQPPKDDCAQTSSYFALQIVLRSLTTYLEYLKKIDTRSRQLETQLYASLQNSELIKMLELQKSLVYFTTSLKSIESMLNKLARLPLVSKDAAHQELFEDVLIESHQALEMANIYSSTLSGVMDAFASIISNNQNLVMKTLTVVTVVISIPTLVFSFYGMNVNLPFDQITADILTWGIPIGIALICTLLTVFFLWRKKSL